MVGEALSYLGDKEQYAVLEQCEMNDCTPSYAQAIEMKKRYQGGNLTVENISEILSVKRQIRGKPLKSQPKNYGNTHRTLMRYSLKILSSKPVSITANISSASVIGTKGKEDWAMKNQTNWIVGISNGNSHE